MTVKCTLCPSSGVFYPRIVLRRNNAQQEALVDVPRCAEHRTILPEALLSPIDLRKLGVCFVNVLGIEHDVGRTSVEWHEATSELVLRWMRWKGSKQAIVDEAQNTLDIPVEALPQADIDQLVLEYGSVPTEFK